MPVKACSASFDFKCVRCQNASSNSHTHKKGSMEVLSQQTHLAHEDDCMQHARKMHKNAQKMQQGCSTAKPTHKWHMRMTTCSTFMHKKCTGMQQGRSTAQQTHLAHEDDCMQQHNHAQTMHKNAAGCTTAQQTHLAHEDDCMQQHYHAQKMHKNAARMHHSTANSPGT